ncbi:MAG: UDP-N-acetylglucosamine--N-acetylmuramyl-(pentapeptide) pyrophosphoryl-undecaprenol N-acetylglucosamine transferase, partial [Pseudomonadota bacterium]
RGVPSALHEQNAVLGRANRMLAKRVTALATSFETVKFADMLPAERVVFTGNPVRSVVVEAAAQPYDPPKAGGPFRLLVFGGSQGARVFSELLPQAVAHLDPADRGRLQVVQQCRPEDLEGVQQRFAELGVEAECAPFFKDLPGRIANSHLVIARSGASTVSELTVIGRPSILVPLPHALDNDQLQNATTLNAAGGCWWAAQKDFDAERAARDLHQLMAAPEQLVPVAHAAKAQGRADADERLADLVETIMR